MSDPEKNWERPVPQLLGGPDPGAPVPRDPVRGVDLAGYGAIAAELAETPGARGEVLAAHQLDELAWLEIEQTWLLRLATAALQRDLSLQDEHDRAFTARQDELGRERPMATAEQMDRVSRAIEEGTAPAVALAREGLRLADWARYQRRAGE